jgi:hypothetical protein
MGSTGKRLWNRRDLVCFYCRLPVRLTSECAHPGYGVIDQVRTVGDTGTEGPLGLRLVHRFCGQALKSNCTRRALRYGLAIRRARLGQATERYDQGLPAKRYDLLGLLPMRLPSAELYRKHWNVRRMQYASKAWRYYTRAATKQ